LIFEVQDKGWADAFNRDRLGYLMRAQRNHGDLIRFPVGAKRGLYLVSNPDHIRYVLVDHPEQFSRGILFKRRASRFLGNGLLVTEGDVNKRQRKLMHPAFHMQRIAGYAEVMIRETDALLSHWGCGGVREVHHDMVLLTMNIVAKTLFGIDNLEEKVDEIFAAITAGIEYLDNETLPEPKEAFARLDTLITEIIETRRAHIAANGTKPSEDRGDLLSMLLMAVDEEGGMTDQQARDEIITLFIAGHETSANALTWGWYLLSQYPEVEAKLLHELDTVLQRRTPTFADIAKLTYTDQVVREILRMYPVAWNQTREVLTDVRFGDDLIPKGSTIIISPFVVHHDPRNYDDPECFDPERFAPDAPNPVPSNVWIPFSMGARYCIGRPFALMEMQIALAMIMQRYHLSLADPTVPVEIEAYIALRPKDGLRMHVQPRG
jgi:cytochrome P450